MKLYLLLLGAEAPGRSIQQHDYFFGIADSLKARHITICVVELTDIFTAGAYPEINKIKRKRKRPA
jgi:hypothetical protein